MSLLGIIIWIVFGAVVGWLAKLIHPGEENISGWGTVLLGVVGSFVGGLINFCLGWGDAMISSSGMAMSVIGAVICCYVYTHKEKIKNWVKKNK